MWRYSVFGMAAALVLTVALQGCSSKSRQISEVATQEFRDRYARSEFDQIYAAGATDFWTKTTHDDFVKLMRGVTRKLGTFRSTRVAGWRVMTGTSGTMVTLGYQTVFEKGPAEEQFIWRVEGNSAKLAGYHINSNAFLAE